MLYGHFIRETKCPHVRQIVTIPKLFGADHSLKLNIHVSCGVKS